jgi:hypothetical protein
MPELPPLLMEIHGGLPRQGPGDAASTARAFAMLDRKTNNPRILDVGCGPGAQTLDLARLSKGPITALDSSHVFLNELEVRTRTLAWRTGSRRFGLRCSRCRSGTALST